jgi:hypothetical protein
MEKMGLEEIKSLKTLEELAEFIETGGFGRTIKFDVLSDYADWPYIRSHKS